MVDSALACMTSSHFIHMLNVLDKYMVEIKDSFYEIENITNEKCNLGKFNSFKRCLQLLVKMISTRINEKIKGKEYTICVPPELYLVKIASIRNYIVDIINWYDFLEGICNTFDVIDDSAVKNRLDVNTLRYKVSEILNSYRDLVESAVRINALQMRKVQKDIDDLNNEKRQRERFYDYDPSPQENIQDLIKETTTDKEYEDRINTNYAKSKNKGR